MNNNEYKNNLPLCVDLDGTLIKTDSILEATILAVKKKPLIIFALFFWILKGKNYFKSTILNIAKPDAELFPYNQDVIRLINDAKSNDRAVVLTTASLQDVAEDVSAYLGLFDELIYSTENHNNRSGNKSKTLNDKFGFKKYDYIGNSSADLDVFANCNSAFLVSGNKSLISKSQKVNSNLTVLPVEKNFFKNLIKELRLYQWVKNLLIFLPLILAHEFNDITAILNSVIAFFCFSFTASFIYVVNDLFDLESDRLHSKKKYRPLAAGELDPKPVFIISFILMLFSFAVGIFYLPNDFDLILLFYLVLTTLYSLYLKKIVIADIITLAVLYSLRIIAGGEITKLPLSKWFITFSLFIFFSLAIIKRYTELKNLIKKNKTKAKGRGYDTGDITLLLILGTSSGYISVLIFLLYIFSPEVTVLYQNPLLLIPVSILLLTWITYMWLKAYRGEMYEDPVVYTVKDKFSYLLFGLMFLFIVGAML
jgi:4-hydroxybenzoate polyprenyltransferase